MKQTGICLKLLFHHTFLSVPCIALCSPPVIWTGKNRCGGVKVRVDGGRWAGKIMKEQEKSSKTIDIVSYALQVSVNGVICV